MTAARWLQLSRPSNASIFCSCCSYCPAASQPLHPSPPPLHSLDTLVSASASVELALYSSCFAHSPQSKARIRCIQPHQQPASTPPPVSSVVLHRTVVSSPPKSTTQPRKEEEAANDTEADAFQWTHTELDSLREAVERWAKRLRRQLLAAALTNDQRTDSPSGRTAACTAAVAEGGQAQARAMHSGPRQRTAEEEDGEGDNEQASPASVDQSSAFAVAFCLHRQQQQKQQQRPRARGAERVHRVCGRASASGTSVELQLQARLLWPLHARPPVAAREKVHVLPREHHPGRRSERHSVSAL